MISIAVPSESSMSEALKIVEMLQNKAELKKFQAELADGISQYKAECDKYALLVREYADRGAVLDEHLKNARDAEIQAQVLLAEAARKEKAAEDAVIRIESDNAKIQEQVALGFKELSEKKAEYQTKSEQLASEIKELADKKDALNRVKLKYENKIQRIKEINSEE